MRRIGDIDRHGGIDGLNGTAVAERSVS